MEYNQNERADFNGPVNQYAGNYSSNNNQRPSLPPKNYLVESILVTILCCLPFGIVGIINANKVEGLFAAGDYDGAQRAADDAKKWCKYGLISGVTVVVLYIIFYIFFFAAMMSSGRF